MANPTYATQHILSHTSTRTGLVKVHSDPMSDTAKGAFWSWDASTAIGWPDQDNPSNGDVVPCLSQDGQDGSIAIPSGSVTYAGNAFDFSGATAKATQIALTSAALASLYAAAPDGSARPGASQQGMVIYWIKCPTLANFQDGATLAAIFAASDSTSGYAATPEWVQIAWLKKSSYPRGGISFRRQRAANTGEFNVIDSTPAEFPANWDGYGRWLQVAWWRDGNEQAWSIRAMADTYDPAKVYQFTGTLAPGINNAQNFGTLTPKWGVLNPFTGGFGNTATSGVTGYRGGRGSIENLAISGRVPRTVLALDWAQAPRALFT